MRRLQGILSRRTTSARPPAAARRRLRGPSSGSRHERRRDRRLLPRTHQPQQGFHPGVGSQTRLRQARLLVAGCGSTGGAAVEPLVRIGVQDFVLADNGEYELNNLNRQHAGHTDIGRNKAEVSAELVLSINPDARDRGARRNGIEPDRVDELVDASDIVIDGVDVTERSGMQAKWALHESAARLRVPVISGYDMAGMQYVRCYDYRTASAPLLRCGHRRAHRERAASWQVLARLIPKRKVPLEMVRNLRASMTDPDYHVSQLVYTSLMFGAIASRLTVELLDRRPVRRSASVSTCTGWSGDLRPTAAMPWPSRSRSSGCSDSSDALTALTALTLRITAAPIPAPTAERTDAKHERQQRVLRRHRLRHRPRRHHLRADPGPAGCAHPAAGEERLDRRLRPRLRRQRVLLGSRRPHHPGLQAGHADPDDLRTARHRQAHRHDR